MNYNDVKNDCEPIYNSIEGIKIYDGTTLESRRRFTRKIKALTNLSKTKLFTEIEPSTLTAKGYLTHVDFEEHELITYIDDLPPEILKAGCNYGEKFGPLYQKPVEKKKSSRGRKPKNKKNIKRKKQGTGKYFCSQITFEIKPNEDVYKIKLFRTGCFQAPGVVNPDMTDLIAPINILKNYLSNLLGEDVQIDSFHAVMRNYKCRLINTNYHVDLTELESVIIQEKQSPLFGLYTEFMLQSVEGKYTDIIRTMLTGYNIIDIAEIKYNPDKCGSLNVKFNRPSYLKSSKKTTVKLLKRGKINFDGGNSEQEIRELYLWLQYIYDKYRDRILFDITLIKNEETDTSPCDEISIYDSSENSESEDNEEPVANPRVQLKHILQLHMKGSNNPVARSIKRNLGRNDEIKEL